MIKIEKTYSELITFDSWEERLLYLRLCDGNVDSPRHMSQSFYKSKPWKLTIEDVRLRDMGWDLGVVGVSPTTKVLVHHINPITEEDILTMSPKLFDMENLILTQDSTHGLIHYNKDIVVYQERKPGDTDLW